LAASEEASAAAAAAAASCEGEESREEDESYVKLGRGGKKSRERRRAGESIEGAAADACALAAESASAPHAVVTQRQLEANEFTRGARREKHRDRGKQSQTTLTESGRPLKTSASCGGADWQLIFDGMLGRLRVEVEEQGSELRRTQEQCGGLKRLVERQMRTQKDMNEALREHTSVITREVCTWTKQYIEFRLQRATAGAGAAGGGTEEAAAANAADTGAGAGAGAGDGADDADTDASHHHEQKGSLADTAVSR